MDITFGVLSTADICVKYGTKLMKTLRAYRDASDILAELILRVNSIWARTEHQLKVLETVKSNLPASLVEHFDLALEPLARKLSSALLMLQLYSDSKDKDLSRRLEDTLKISRWRKTKLAVLESNVKSIVQDLETRYELFNPSWYLITLVPNPQLDTELRVNTSLERDNPSGALSAIRGAIHNAQSQALSSAVTIFTNLGPYTDVPIEGSHIMLRKFKGANQSFVVDVTDFQEQDAAAKLQGIQAFSSLLGHIEPQTMKLLRCAGSIKGSQQYEILYDLPHQLHTPQSLRHCLETTKPSLDQRLALAKSLARATTSVHALNIVHKNIRPETLLVFTEPPSSHASHKQSGHRSQGKLTAYLAGFEQFRLTSDHSSMVADMLWDKNLYRHPKRQGRHPEEEYIMQHDIYSLGVCLLEVGMWSSFVYRTSKGEATLGDDLDIQEQLDMRNKRKAANEVKTKLIQMAIELLPSRMGETFTDIVCSCLQCLDKDRGDFGNIAHEPGENADDETLGVGMEYIDRVLTRLESIRL